MVVRALAFVVGEQMSPSLRPRRSPFAVSGDRSGARVREEEAPLGVDDDDAVGGALEEIGVALERS